jgi:Family of unknown function (DUF6335)
MAKRKPARAKAASKSTRSSARSRKAVKARSGRSRRAAVRRGARRPSARKAAPKTRAAKRLKKSARRPAPKTSRTATAKKTAPPTRKAALTEQAAKPKRARRPPSLDRARRTAAEAEGVPTPPSSLNLDRHTTAAQSGRRGLGERLQQHTSTSPALTAGDVDADWEAAEAIGDEAPGGDNPTPDQDIVDNIGRALGVEYDDDEELKGGDEITARDRHRWELDPASSDDYDDRE